MNWFKITMWMQKGDKSPFDISVEKQKAFLLSLGDPHNILDRSYKQYLCQNLFLPKVKVILFNFIFGFFFPLVLVYYVVKGFFAKEVDKVLAIIEDKKMPEVVPFDLLNYYHPNSAYWNCGSFIKLKDLEFIINLIQTAPLSPYYVFKVTMNLAQYSAMIHSHMPNVIIQFGEFSFSRTAMTHFCHRNNVKHINVMHGEKLFFIRDSFFQYDKCYVWHEHYVELLKSMGAEPTQFVIQLPQSMRIETESYKNKDVYADYKYYLALVSDGEMKIIKDSVDSLIKQGISIKFRPHPRYTNMNILKKYVPEEMIEYGENVPILESLSNVSTVIGVYSTVLVQAFFSDINVMLDDVSNPNQYRKLKEMDYILVDKVKDRLSLHQ